MTMADGTTSESSKPSIDDIYSYPEFGQGTNGSDVAEALKQHINARVVVITGVSPKSLGEALAVTIAKHGPAYLILASRTISKMQAVSDEMRQSSPDVRPVLIELDLGSFDSVRKAAAEIYKHVSHIDILINNAAVVSPTRQETVHGLELNFGTNLIGPMLFTSLLTPLLVKAAERTPSLGVTRIVNVSSLAYVLSPIRFHDYNFEGKSVPPEEEQPARVRPHMRINNKEGRPYVNSCAYAQSKTGNILHAISLNERLRDKGVIAFAVHPGSIWTDLPRNLPQEDVDALKKSADDWVTHDQGIASILVAALDPKLARSENLVFFNNCTLRNVLPHARDPRIADRLWQLCENLTGEHAKL